MVNFKNSLYDCAIVATLVSGIYANIEIWRDSNRIDTILQRKGSDGRTIGEYLEDIKRSEAEIKKLSDECVRMANDNQGLAKKISNK